MIYCTQREFDRKTLSGEWFNTLQLSSHRWQVTVRSTNQIIVIFIKD